MRTIIHGSRRLGAAMLLAGAGMLAAIPARGQGPTTDRWHLDPGALVYLDGQRTTAAAIQTLADEAIAQVEGLRGPAGVARLLGDTTATEVLILTTKANANSPAVLALANRAHLGSAYATRPVALSVVAPAALAYITGHYPSAWLGGEVLELTRKSSGAVKYRVQLADTGGFRYVSFTAGGEFVDAQLW